MAVGSLKLRVRAAGKFFFQYREAKKTYSYLKKSLPLFIRRSFDDVNGADGKRMLVVSIGWYDAKTEAVYAKALQTAGYDICVITRWDPYVAKIFRVFGIKKVYFYRNYSKDISFKKLAEQAQATLRDTPPEKIISIQFNGINAGKYAASSFMRATRSSKIDVRDKNYEVLKRQLVLSFRAAVIAERVIEALKPQLLFVNDRGYTPVGQIFDACLKRGTDVIQRCSSHKSGSEIIKRYKTSAMSGTHHSSLSDDSWELIKRLDYTEGLWKTLRGELKTTYESGDWYSVKGTQFNTRLYSKRELVSKLGLDENKKTAVVFPHIFWDATFFWGEDLFADYYDWFINVLKAAGENNNLNWVVKIHPANVIKARRDNQKDVSAELKAIERVLGLDSGRVKVIGAKSDINTFSLFSLMDYCLTVRGTIGIESAAFGVNTLTAGTGRYDRRGFTHDFSTKEDYLNRLKKLEELPPMEEEKTRLARKFAYGIFVLRPIRLDLLEHGYRQDNTGTMKFKPLFRNEQEFEGSEFVNGFRDFVISGKEDFLSQKL